MDGASIIAKSLRDQEVEYVFGIVGIPIVEISLALQAENIKYVGMRNEQAVSFERKLQIIYSLYDCCTGTSEVFGSLQKFIFVALIILVMLWGIN